MSKCHSISPSGIAFYSYMKMDHIYLLKQPSLFLISSAKTASHTKTPV